MSNHQTIAGAKDSPLPFAKSLLSNLDTFTSSTNKPTDLLCFSHLRWNFVYQRPQHLLNRASQNYRVWFWEEPIADDHAWLEVRLISPQLHILVPHLPSATEAETGDDLQRHWLNELLVKNSITHFITWYYTPMSLAFTEHLMPELTVYDCMDELSAFLGASPLLRDREKQLLNRAKLVFTGGYSLFEVKQKLHPSVHAFPSSIDYDHFVAARKGLADPADQHNLPYPRIGYSGVIDERLDRNLLAELARRRPDWQFILLGPIVKIDPASLPQGPNLHYLGMKSYAELPAYFSNWQMALLPFELNEATRFISPTKTPEYLTAGLPVVSTPIRDVVTTYSRFEPVRIADTVSSFERAIENGLQSNTKPDWTDTDAHLQQQSWAQTWKAMHGLILNQLYSQLKLV